MPGAHTYFGFWGEWLLNQKVVFDGPTRTILIEPNTTVIDVQVDLYSAWKDWSKVRDNLKFLQAMRSTGGDPLPGDLKLGSTYFLVNGWRILLTHGVTFNGNLYTEEGDSPFITQDDVQIAISTVSNLVDRVETPATNPPEVIAQAIWNALKSAYNLPGTFGEAVAAAQAAAVAVDNRLPPQPAEAAAVDRVRKIVTPTSSLL